MLNYDLSENLAYFAFNQQISGGIRIGGRHIDYYQIISSEIVDKSRCRINHKGSTADDQSVCIGNSVYCAVYNLIVKLFAVQNNIGLYKSSALTVRNSLTFQHIFGVKKLSVFAAVVSVN